MELIGLSLTEVLTVLGGFGAAVLVLYLLKLRRRQVTVPFVKLWESILAERQTTRLLSQLKRWLSFLLSLAIVALVAFSLGDPRYLGATAEGRTVVVLVDASASMQATDVAPTRFEAARARVETMIEELGPSDRMLIAELGSAAVPVTPLSGESLILRNGLENLEVADVRADVEAGVRLALDILRGQPNPEIVLLSDGRLGDLRASAERLAASDVRLSWTKIGRRGRNVGISAFAVRRYPIDKSQSEVLVELWNPTGRDEAIEMTLLGDGEEVDIQRLTVKKGERLRRFFQNISGVDQTLEARIRLADGSTDDLAIDDRAFARLPERRRARILAVSSDNLYLQAALLLDEYLDVTEITPTEYPAEGRFDITIFDGFVPPTPPFTDALYLHPLGDGAAPFEVEGVAESPHFEVIDRRHPLTRWTALRDVNIADALRVRLQPGDQAVAGDHNLPLIVAGQRNEHDFVALNFDVRRSDFALRIAWPMFLLNAIDWFVQENAGYFSSYQTGDTWYVPVPAGIETAVVIDPHDVEHTAPVVEGRAVFAGERTGFYRVQTQQGDDVFAVNLGAGDESAIKPPETLELGGRTAEAATRGQVGLRSELWVYLVLLVFLIVALEWFSYHRRITV